MRGYKSRKNTFQFLQLILIIMKLIIVPTTTNIILRVTLKQKTTFNTPTIR